MEQFFVSKPNLRFITLKGSKDNQKHQKIGYWSDRIRKISSNYYIIREKNYLNSGYHFHALVSLSEPDIKKSWFVKDVHMHVKHVGDLKPQTGKPMFPESEEEHDYMLYGEDIPEEINERVLTVELEKLRIRKRNKCLFNKKNLHIKSVLTYMSKHQDILLSSQFTDYCYVKNAKHFALAA